MTTTAESDLDALPARAWALLTHPEASGAWPGWALDYLQDYAGTSREAFAALCRAAADALPEKPNATWRHTHEALVAHISGAMKTYGAYSSALKDIQVVRRYAKESPDSKDFGVWAEWADRAEQAVRILEAIREDVREG